MLDKQFRGFRPNCCHLNGGGADCEFRPFGSVKDELETADLTAGKEIIVDCETSPEGSLLTFYSAHVARYPTIRLDAGSWKEHASQKQHPTETDPN